MNGQPLKVYTESGSVVVLIDGFLMKWEHIHILRELAEHIPQATVKVRDEYKVEWNISVSNLRLDLDLIRMLNPSAA